MTPTPLSWLALPSTLVSLLLMGAAPPSPPEEVAPPPQSSEVETKSADAPLPPRDAHALGVKGALEGFDPLIDALSQAESVEDQQVYLRALEKLNYTTPFLVQALAGHSESVARSYAAYTLGRMRASEAVPELLVALGDKDPEVRAKVITALGAIGDPRAFEGLIKAAHRDPNPALRKRAEEEATRLGAGGSDYIDEETLIARLGSPDPIDRKDAATKLGRSGSWWAVPPLIATLADPSPEVRERAIASLGELRDSRASSALYAHVQSTQGMERYLCLASISLIGDAGAREAIEPYLRSDDVHSRRAAARALGTLGDDDAIPALASAFNGEVVPDIKQEFVGALGRLMNPLAVPTLKKATQPKEAEGVRYAAIRALGGIPHPDALPPLIALLKDEEPLVRASAIDAMAPRDDAARDDALITTLERMAREDNDAYAQQAALEAATALRGKARLLGVPQAPASDTP